MHIVFSCENTQYMWWQAELLHYTYKKDSLEEIVGQFRLGKLAK